MTSCPFVRRTLATLRNAEFGFFGVRVITCTQTPRRCGQFASAGDFDFTVAFLRPFRTSWLIVGILKKFGGRLKKTPPGGISPSGCGEANYKDNRSPRKFIFHRNAPAAPESFFYAQNPRRAR